MLAQLNISVDKKLITKIDRIKENATVVADEHKADASKSTQSDVSPTTRARRIVKELEGPEFMAFGELCDALKKGRTPSEKGWRESLPDLQNRLAGIRRQLSELARDVAQQDMDLAKANEPQLLSHKFCVKGRKFQTKSCRLCMNSMRSSNTWS